MPATSARASIIFLVIAGLFLPAWTFAASMRLVPASAALREGETIQVSVIVGSPDQAMNAASGVLKFPSDLLQVTSLSKSGSVIGVWVQEPSFSNSAGTINFEGVALNPGYTGQNGTVLIVTFRARAEGTAPVSITEGSVLANDGNGTEILAGTTGATLAIAKAQAAPPSAKPAPIKPDAPAAESAPRQEPVYAEPEAPRGVVEKGYDPRPLWAWFTGAAFPGKLLFVLLVLAFLVLDGLLLALYLRKRTEKGRKLDHAQVLTHRSFLLLREDIDSFVKELESEAESRKLSATEERFVKEMRGDLSEGEKAIVQELRSAEKDIK